MTFRAEPEQPAGWLARHTTILDTLNPDTHQVTDLQPVRATVGDARVVAVGEGAHFVEEFTHARARLLRYLIEHCGFTVVAFELGALDADAINPWLAGHGADSDLPRVSGPLTVSLFGELLRWLRDYNRGRRRPVQVLGIDLPNSLTLRPDLDRVVNYLRRFEPEVADLTTGALSVADEITGGSAVVSASQWASLSPARQDALTAWLARLSRRLRTLGSIYVSRSGQEPYEAALQHLESACYTDYMLRAMSELFSGGGMSADTSARDHYLAASVLRHLQHIGSDTRMVVVAHNNHIQKTPVRFGAEVTALPMGYYLSSALGGNYCALGLTHTDQQVPEMSFPAPESPLGFRVEPVPLDAPAPGSIEYALIEAGLGQRITFTDLRSLDPELVPLDQLRSQAATVRTRLGEAFDAVLSVPSATMDGTARF